MERLCRTLAHCRTTSFGDAKGSHRAPTHGKSPPSSLHPLPSALISSLQKLLGDRLRLGQSDRELRGKDRSYHEMKTPQAVCLPKNEDEVKEIAKLCTQAKVPIIAYGRGTSLEGHITAVSGGVSLDFSRFMNRLLVVHKDDLDCVVEPGISYEELNKQLRKDGLMFSCDPGPGATLGGMVATSCSGPNAVRYGTMKAQVLGLRAVLASGEIIKTANRARKSSAGYDLTHLFVGSEGTLGLVTQITLKLQIIPPFYSAAVCSFQGVKEAMTTVLTLIQKGIVLGRAELLDALMMKAVNMRSKLNYPEMVTLFFELTSTDEETLKRQTDTVRQVCTANGGSHFHSATQEEEREKIWEARKLALFSSRVLRPGSQTMITDVAVPISRLSECLAETSKDTATSPLPAPLVAHAGDGNFHLFILFDPNNPKELAEANRINKRLVARAIEMEGTCTGEHGIGLGKKEYLSSELGVTSIDVMRKVKKALDPHNIMNPGKIFDS